MRRVHGYLEKAKIEFREKPIIELTQNDGE